MGGTPPSWQRDPWWPGRLRWWDGNSWAGYVAPYDSHGVPKAARGASEVVRAGASGATRRWASWLVIAHLTLVPLLTLYLVLVGVNSWVYEYSFWNDPPPTAHADVVAVASLWALAVVAGFTAAFGWGWLCRHAVGEESLWESGRGVIRPVLRRCWYAIPLMIVTASCVLLVVPGVVAVALVGVVPLLSLAPARPAGGYVGLLSRCTVPLAAVGCVAIPISALFWTTVGSATLMASVFPPLAWVIGWVGYCAESIVMGGTASAFASAYLEDQEAGSA